MNYTYCTFLACLLIFLTSFRINANAGSDIIIHPDERLLEAPQAETYQWYLDGELLENGNHQKIEVKKAGEYTVFYTNVYGTENKLTTKVALVGGKIIRIYLIGDSTMQDYSVRSDYLTQYYPMAGWGEKFQAFLSSDSLHKIANIIETDSVVVINKAIGGRSSRLFWEEGRWQELQDLLKPGDYVFIQFGHNDAASCTDYPDRCTSIPDFKNYLGRFVDSSRVKGAIPLLITPINRDYPWSGGKITNVHGGYPNAMKEVAVERDVPLIDGTQRSLDLFNEKGEQFTSSHYFMVFDAGVYPNYRVTAEYPNGSPANDHTHLQLEGAHEISRLIFEGLQDLVKLSIEKPVDTSGIITGAGWYEKKYNPEILISASPNMGWKFDNWSGDISSTQNPMEIILDTHKTVVANFTETNNPQYFVDVGIEGSGSLNLSPFGGLYEEGSSIQVDITPDANWEFYTWVGDYRTTDNPLNFSIDENTKITAILLENDSRIFQAEDAIASNGSVNDTGKNYTGNGYVKTENENEFSISWNVYPEESRYYGIIFRYAYESDTNLSADFYINGELTNRIVEFEATGSEDSWLYSKKFNYSIKPGENNIKIVVKNISGILNIDFLKILGSGVFLDGPSSIDHSAILAKPVIKVFPNPGVGQFQVELTLDHESNISFTLFSITGQEIFNTASNIYSEGTHKILMSENKIEPGIYTLIMNLNHKKYAEKLIITN